MNLYTNRCMPTTGSHGCFKNRERNVRKQQLHYIIIIVFRARRKKTNQTQSATTYIHTYIYIRCTYTGLEQAATKFNFARKNLPTFHVCMLGRHSLMAPLIVCGTHVWNFPKEQRVSPRTNSRKSVTTTRQRLSRCVVRHPSTPPIVRG